MSRCTPNIHSWGTRAKRYGGKAGIATRRALQFQALAGFPVEHRFSDGKTAGDYLAFLEGNPVRVLSVNTEIVIGFRKSPEQIRQEEMDTVFEAFINATADFNSES